MLDIKLLRKNRESIEKKLKTKDPSIELSAILELDQEIRTLIAESEELKSSRNQKSKEVGDLKKAGQEASALMQEVKEIGDRIATLDQRHREVEKEFIHQLSHVPNLPMDEVMVSQNKEDNVCIKVVGEKPHFSFPVKNHVELNEKLKLFDFERAAKTTGSHWPCYKGMGAHLEWALLNYFIEIQQLRGFEFHLPPLTVKPEMMFGSAQLPKFKGQFYEIKDEAHPLYLIPTAEVALNALHYDEIFEEEVLPKKYSAYTPCFRREAGSLGAQERGLIRMHQFNKVEMFAFTTPEQSAQLFDEMISVAEQILQGLQLHYRLCLLVTGDMSFAAAKTVDIEVWLPGQNRYMEVSSISNCTDYQARRSQIRWRKKGGKPELVHTLNGSGLATSRVMVALLETYQDKEGRIHLPPILAERVHTSILEG
jgi:seryl-tRNA synthetase